jgi:hypothetical protein
MIGDGGQNVTQEDSLLSVKAVDHFEGKLGFVYDLYCRVKFNQHSYANSWQYLKTPRRRIFQ